LSGNQRQCGGTLGVDGDPVMLVGRQILDFINRTNRANGNAGSAIDAYHRIDVEHFVVGVKTDHRADGHAVGEAAQVAIVSDYGCHRSCPVLAEG
jgi:hypothetical protein